MRWKAKITVPADIRFLGIVASFVSQMAKLSGMVQEEIFQVELAVDEACTNVIVHGYEEDGLQSFSVTCNFDEEAFLAEVEDHGKCFDFDAVPEPDIDAPIEERKVGGLGIYLIRQTMDQVTYQKGKDGFNRLSMKKSLKRKG